MSLPGACAVIDTNECLSKRQERHSRGNWQTRRGIKTGCNVHRRSQRGMTPFPAGHKWGVLTHRQAVRFPNAFWALGMAGESRGGLNVGLKAETAITRHEAEFIHWVI